MAEPCSSLRECLDVGQAFDLLICYSHRLSTVTSADQILVLHAGKVVESGTHHELLAIKGRYASMWKKQIRAERAFEAASKMVEKANALQKAAMERPGSSGNEEGASGDVSENEADNRSSTTLAPSLSNKGAFHAAEAPHTETTAMDDSFTLEDKKPLDLDVNSGATTSATAYDKTEVEEGELVPAEAENSKTREHS